MNGYLFDMLNPPPDPTAPPTRGTLVCLNHGLENCQPCLHGLKKFGPPTRGTQTVAPHPADAARLSPQCQLILALLRAGPVSNTTMARIALKYTGRISDLRGAGHNVEVFRRDRETGVCWYRLGTQEE